MIRTYLPGTRGGGDHFQPGEPGTVGEGAASRTHSPPSPIKLVEIEISHPLPEISAHRANGHAPYRQASLLIRLHGRVLGALDIGVPREGLRPTSVARLIWGSFATDVRRHLVADDLAAIDDLPPSGVHGADAGDVPPCRDDRALDGSRRPFVSVIVSTAGRPERLGPCLEGLLSMAYETFEVIVVDNAPHDRRTARMLESRYAGDPRVRYAVQPVRGLSAARNRGLEMSRAPISAFADDDVLVDRHWLTAMIRAFDGDHDVACVTGLVLPTQLETPAELWFEQYGGFVKGYRRRVFDLHDNRDADRLYPYAAGLFGTGASMAFRTDVLRELGGFSTALGAGTRTLGGEDLDAFLNVLAAGHRLVYEPDAIMRHPAPSDFRQLLRQLRQYGTGLTAMMTKQLIEDSRHRPQLMRRIPRGIWFALNPRSTKNAGKSATYPRLLTLGELGGMLLGPGAYLRSRRVDRSRKRSGR